MKIVVTGATGFVGQFLVPLLAARDGIELLLVGREPSKLAELFPGISACAYSELEECGTGFDVLLHLAVVNNDATASYEEFHDVNVRKTVEIAEAARSASITRFVNVSSIHALDEKNDTPYAVTKRAAVKKLEGMKRPAITTLYLPAVYGDRWSGQLAVLNKLPQSIAWSVFKFLAAFKPTVHVSRIADFLIELSGDCGSDFILSDGQRKNLTYRFFKRCMDFGFALTIAIFFWWLLLLVWIVVKIQSSGPGIFAQERVGKDGRIFTCYKFRTMKKGTSQAGTHEISEAQVTSVGAFLRRTKLDELPQIVNIFRGEIGLIGPRPCLPTQVGLIGARQQRGVDKALPGISGLAQINGIDMSRPEVLAQWDQKYLALQSIMLDIKVALATALGRGAGDRVTSRPN